MRRLATVRWQSPPPTSADEELAAYDDGSAWLVVRSSRDGAATIGTWSVTPSPEDHAALVAVGDVEVDLLHPQLVPEVAERLRVAALANPVATAGFLAMRGAGESVTLAAAGGGTRPVQFEVDPGSLAVHVEKEGAELAWFEPVAPETGFITPTAEGLGGLGRRAVIAPGVVGALVLEVPQLAQADGDGVAVSASGWLAEGLPDEPMPARFHVRTVPRP
jgi:hypothetical protein